MFPDIIQCVLEMLWNNSVMDLDRQINLSRNSVKFGEAHVLSVQIPLEAMAIQDTYLRYNRERRYLVYWMTNAATKIRRNMQVESSMSTSPPGVVSLETQVTLETDRRTHEPTKKPLVFPEKLRHKRSNLPRGKIKEEVEIAGRRDKYRTTPTVTEKENPTPLLLP